MTFLSFRQVRSLIRPEVKLYPAQTETCFGLLSERRKSQQERSISGNSGSGDKNARERQKSKVLEEQNCRAPLTLVSRENHYPQHYLLTTNVTLCLQNVTMQSSLETFSETPIDAEDGEKGLLVKSRLHHERPDGSPRTTKKHWRQFRFSYRKRLGFILETTRFSYWKQLGFLTLWMKTSKSKFGLISCALRTVFTKWGRASSTGSSCQRKAFSITNGIRGCQSDGSMQQTRSQA